MSDEVRCYFVIDASAPRSTGQWWNLIQAAKAKPLLKAVQQASNAHMPCNKVNVCPSVSLRYVLIEFEIDRRDRPNLIALLEAQCILRGILGGMFAKFEGLLQAELREAAVDLGYTVGQAEALSVNVIGLGDRKTAIKEAHIWFEPYRVEWEIVED